MAPRYEVSVVEKADDEVSDYCEMREYVKTCGHAGGVGLGGGPGASPGRTARVRSVERRYEQNVLKDDRVSAW